MPSKADEKNGGVQDGKYMGSLKVGAKGQVVIPKDVRDMFGISPGDTLILLADIDRGIALQRFDFYDKISQHIFNPDTNGGNK